MSSECIYTSFALRELTYMVHVLPKILYHVLCYIILKREMKESGEGDEDDCIRKLCKIKV